MGEPSLPSPPEEAERVLPGVLTGSVVGAVFIGIADSLACFSSMGIRSVPETMGAVALGAAIIGAVAGLPWGLALARLDASGQAEVTENPRWWGFCLGASVVGWLALCIGGPLAGHPGAMVLATLILLLFAAGTPLAASQGSSRLLVMFALITGLGIQAVLRERPGPTDWPPTGAANVLLVTIDGLGADDLDDEAATTNLAALASDGVRLGRAVTPVPERVGAHRGLWLGPDAWAPGVLAGGAPPAGAQTLAQRFSSAGWWTAGFASDAALDTRALGDGFTQWDADRTWLRAWGHTAIGRTAALLAPPPDRRRGDHTVDRALDWLAAGDRSAGRPVFLWVHLADPTFPWAPPPPWDTAFYDADPYDPANATLSTEAPSVVRRAFPEVTDLDRVRASQRGGVAHADAQLGRLREALQGSGERWVVAVAGTSGAVVGDHGRWTASGPVLDERSVVVPLVLVAPGHLPRGARVDEAVELTDLALTLAELAGLPEVAEEGTSLVPLAFGRREDGLARTALPGAGVLVVDGDGAWRPGGGDPAPSEAHRAQAAEAQTAVQP